MNKMNMDNLKKSIIHIGCLLWEKDLASGLNGNLSVRLDGQTILITGHGTCLGALKEDDLLRLRLDGTLVDEGKVSTEKLLHTEIYKNYPETGAVVHTHTPYTNGYFLAQLTFAPDIFEAKMQLGTITAVPQATPAVTDAAPVMKAFASNNIVVLKNHGVVAKGKELFDCFLLIQALEEAIKTDSVRRLYQLAANSSVKNAQGNGSAHKKYKLFSKEQINEIVRHVNEDATMKDLGVKTKMTMNLAVKIDETGQVYQFKFRNGNIAEVSHEDDAEFVINAPEKVWRAVFNREIDPFVATTQKKMHLKGDFAKISQWYAPCSRVFELWQRVPVE